MQPEATTQETPVVSMRQLVTDGLRERARVYVGCLVPGDSIIETVDGQFIAPFRAYIPGALAARGWCLDEIEDSNGKHVGFRVRAVRL